MQSLEKKFLCEELVPAVVPVVYLRFGGLGYVSTHESERLRQFWETRYVNYTLQESGIKGLSDRYAALYYRCKRAAYLKALRLVTIASGNRIRVLDAGAGQGYFASLCCRYFTDAEYVGLDISSRAINYLQQQFPKYDWHHCDFTASMPVPLACVDLVQSIEVLHLIIDDSSYEIGLSNLCGALKPGGTMVVTEVLPDTRENPVDYICFREREWVLSLFRRIGLELISEFPMYYFLPDRGPQNRYLAKFFRQLHPSLVYFLDRMALRLRMPQFKQTHDSRMKMIVLRKPLDKI